MIRFVRGAAAQGSVRSRLLALGLVSGLAAGIAGCGGNETIESYRVPKQHLVEAENKVDPPAGSAAATPPAPKEEQRTLAAIVLQETQGWFFKLTGPVAAVGEQTEEFDTFVKSIRFEGDKPRWTLVEGWKELPGSGFRFATIEIPADDKPLELSITSLPKGAGEEDDYLLSNINRWRGQVSLPPIRQDELATETTKVSLGDLTATVVDLVGMGSGGGMGQPPFAGGGRVPAGPVASSGRAEPKAAQQPSALRYEAPKQWAQGRVSDMRKAAFEVKEGDQKVEITAIDLELVAGELLPNVNRWRGQVKLPEIDQKQLDQEAEEVKIDGATGHYVELVGPNEGERPQTILGVVVKAAGKSWFFKLTGDSSLAEREKSRFEAFVKSVKFNQSAGAGDGD